MWSVCVIQISACQSREPLAAKCYFQRMTFWPRFPISRNDLGNWVEVKDMLTSRPALSTEFRGGSCHDSQIGWRPHIRKGLPGCIIAHSKTPANLYTTGLAGDWCECAGVGTEVGSGWDVVGMGGGDGCAWNCIQFPLFSDMFCCFPLYFRMFSDIVLLFSDICSAIFVHFPTYFQYVLLSFQ